MWEIKIVLTGVFDDVGIRHQARLFLYRPRLGIDLGVINRNLNIQMPEVRTPKTFGDVQCFRNGLACLTAGQELAGRRDPLDGPPLGCCVLGLCRKL